MRSVISWPERSGGAVGALRPAPPPRWLLSLSSFLRAYFFLGFFYHHHLLIEILLLARLCTFEVRLYLPTVTHAYLKVPKQCA